MAGRPSCGLRNAPASHRKRGKGGSPANDGSTALTAAVDCRDIRCMEFLLAAHAKVDAQRHDGMTALMLAVAKGDSKAATVLLKAGAAVNMQNKDGMTALVLASRRIDPKLVKLLLEQDNISSCLDFQQKNGSTALMLACARGACEGADLLIRHGANLDLRDACGRGALRILANHNARARRTATFLVEREVTAKLLVDRGAEMDFSHYPSANAQAALAIACRQGYMEVFELATSMTPDQAKRTLQDA